MDTKSERTFSNDIDIYLKDKKGVVVLDRNDGENYVSYKSMSAYGIEETTDVFLASPEDLIGERIRNSAGGVLLKYHMGDISVSLGARFVGKVPHDFLEVTYNEENSLSWVRFDPNGALERLHLTYSKDPPVGFTIVKNGDNWDVDGSPVSFPYDADLGDTKCHAQIDEGMMAIRVTDNEDEHARSLSAPLKIDAVAFYQKAKADGKG